MPIWINHTRSEMVVVVDLLPVSPVCVKDFSNVFESPADSAKGLSIALTDSDESPSSPVQPDVEQTVKAFAFSDPPRIPLFEAGDPMPALMQLQLDERPASPRPGGAGFRSRSMDRRRDFRPSPRNASLERMSKVLVAAPPRIATLSQLNYDKGVLQFFNHTIKFGVNYTKFDGCSMKVEDLTRFFRPGDKLVIDRNPRSSLSPVPSVLLEMSWPLRLWARQCTTWVGPAFIRQLDYAQSLITLVHDGANMVCEGWLCDTHIAKLMEGQMMMVRATRDDNNNWTVSSLAKIQPSHQRTVTFVYGRHPVRSKEGDIQIGCCEDGYVLIKKRLLDEQHIDDTYRGSNIAIESFITPNRVPYGCKNPVFLRAVTIDSHTILEKGPRLLAMQH